MCTEHLYARSQELFSVGCGNSGARLKKWMDNLCPVHECSQGRGICDCVPPFSLFPFPTDLQSSERRQQWIKLIDRKDKKGKNWQPKSDSRVCRKHFPDGRPTSQNLNPTINLGYKTISSTKVPRKQPSVREGKHPVARRNICLKSSNSEFFQAHSTKSIGSSTSSKGGEQCSKH